MAFSLLSACSWSEYVSSASKDYNLAVEATIQNNLAVNVLRGMEQKPLIFSEISQIRGSISSSLEAQAAWPFGPFNNNGRTNSVQAGPISLSNNPTFDVAPLNTKQFTQGILQSVSVNVLNYYLRNQFCRNVAFTLFINSVDEVEVREIENAKVFSTIRTVIGLGLPKLMREWAGDDDCVKPLEQLSVLPRMLTSRQYTQIVPSVPYSEYRRNNSSADIVKMNNSNIKVVVSGGVVQILRSSNQTFMCVPSPSSKGSFDLVVFSEIGVSGENTDPFIPEGAVCEQSHRSSPGTLPAPKTYVAHLRSIQRLFYFLGGLLDRNNAEAADNVETLKFYFHTQPPAATAFSILYGGRTYYVSKWIENTDYTLPILAVLNDLTNLHRDASEVPSTRAVQAISR